MRHRTWLAVGLLVLGLRTISFAETPASKVIAQLDATILEVLKDAETLGFQGRVDRLKPAVETAFDLPFMAEKSLGQQWQPLSDADKQRWVALSREFTVTNYAANFSKWSNQTIDQLGEEASAADTVVVKTRINDPGGDSVDMNYRMREANGAWKVVDVYLKGTVSELALRRSDYTALLEKEGFEALAKTMQRKIDDIRSGVIKK